MVSGLEAKSVLEFGAGGSTAVILDALQPAGMLLSMSTESMEAVRARFGFTEFSRADRANAGPVYPTWRHHQGLSTEVCAQLLNAPRPVPFDMVLHDGSHAADVVEADLRWALPRLRQFGLCLVHDSQHSYVGAEVRKALRAVLATPPEGMILTAMTLPYGSGLTILRREDTGRPPIMVTRVKVGSPHRTEPTCL